MIIQLAFVLLWIGSGLYNAYRAHMRTTVSIVKCYTSMTLLGLFSFLVPNTLPNPRDWREGTSRLYKICTVIVNTYITISIPFSVSGWFLGVNYYSIFMLNHYEFCSLYVMVAIFSIGVVLAADIMNYFKSKKD
jgi:hypothetical protein